MKHLIPISKAAAGKDVGWFNILNAIISIVSALVPLISAILAKQGSES